MVNERMIDEILGLVQKHEQWRGQKCINLIPSENVMSPMVRSLLSSELVHRYTARDSFYMGTRFIDEIEQYGEKLAKDVFKAENADLRPLSGHVADLIFLASFTNPGDKFMCVSADDGGYPGMGEEGLSSLLQLQMVSLPFSKRVMNVKVEESVNLIMQKKPKTIIFGQSLFLFPHPVRELVKAAEEVDTHVGYDGSHVLGLIAGRTFQNPLKEGASALFGSTHKTLFGPQGGILLADKEHGEVMKESIYPMFVDNAHWNRIAALTLALAEMKKYGRKYAQQVIRNAQTLAKTLIEHGFPVVAAEVGGTESHQVLLDYGGYKEGRTVAQKLESANIIVDSGVRLGTCELTRKGMKEREMEKIAELIKDIVVDHVAPNQVKREVTKFAEDFQTIKYCFNQ
jgi:glycine hydroxymethyltransferase